MYEISVKQLKSIRVKVSSSLVESLEYSHQGQCLTVFYRKRSVWRRRVRRYNEVMPAEFFDLLNTDSIGRAVMRLDQKPHLV